MIIKKVFVSIVISVLFFSCHNEFYIPKKNRVSFEIPLLEIKNNDFYNILDSIIIIKDIRFKNVRKKQHSVISFAIYPRRNDVFTINIKLKCKSDLENSVGGFYYKGNLFYIIERDKEMLKNSDIFQRTECNIQVDNIGKNFACELINFSYISVKRNSRGKYFISEKEIFIEYLIVR